MGSLFVCGSLRLVWVFVGRVRFEEPMSVRVVPTIGETVRCSGANSNVKSWVDRPNTVFDSPVNGSLRLCPLASPPCGRDWFGVLLVEPRLHGAKDHIHGLHDVVRLRV